MSVELKNLKKYINDRNMSSTFRSLMNKYKNKLKLSRELNKEIILRQIYSKIRELENEQRENDFIISEARRNAQINQEILYSFGTKALNHLNEVFKVNVTTKIDKNLFLGNNEVKNLKNKRTSLPSVKNQFLNRSKNNYRYKDNKFIILPRIIINKENDSKVLEENTMIKNRTKQNTPKNRRKDSNKKYNYSSFSKEKTSGNNSYSINNLTPIKKRQEKSNDSIILVNAPLLTERGSKRKMKIDDEYINYIKTMGNEFIETEKKQEQYFYKNNYGVDAFKLKYNLLKKKFLN